MVVKDSPLTSCTNPMALGWIGVFIFFCIIILGAYVLPTVLIGIVVISFEEASRKAEQMQEMLTKMVTVIGEAQEEMPDFFTEGRIDKLRTVFEEMDADGELTLDINEMTPFFEYTFQKVFDLKLSKEQQEQLFHLMDLDGDTELGFAEFVMFVVVIKQIEEKAERDPMFAAAAFPKSFSTKKMAAAAASGGGAVKALPGSLDAKLNARNKLGDKGRVGSTPEERQLDAGRSLPEVVALAIDSQRIADRVLRDKRGEVLGWSVTPDPASFRRALLLAIET
jgi:Ca2+-binding EF-hand superfamily protein